MSVMCSVRGSAARAAVALVVLLAPAAVADGPLLGTGILSSLAEARTPTSVCFWENVKWSELSPAEQSKWETLGRSAANWEQSSDESGWDDLTDAQRSTAISLGYRSDTWGDTHCPNVPEMEDGDGDDGDAG
jgi:hypothetical protein